MKNRFSRLAGLCAIALTLSGPLAIARTPTAHAVPLLDQQGTLRPATDEYPIDVEAGDVITIRMTSDEFDTLLILLGPDGEEVAFNDDAEGSLNSRIVYTVPTSGTYTIVARSYGGNGGNYSLQVGPATDYEITFGAAQAAIADGDYGAAQTLFTEAISLNPDAAEAYLARVDAYFGEVYEQLEAEGRFFEGPSDLPDDIRMQIVDDFLVAAALYEDRGEIFVAESLREQAEYFRTGEYPETPAPEATPEPESEALPAEEAQEAQ